MAGNRRLSENGLISCAVVLTPFSGIFGSSLHERQYLIRDVM